MGKTIDTSKSTVSDAPGLPRPAQLHSLAELLSDPAALEPPAATIPRLAYRGRVSLVSGREKTAGKSTLLAAGVAALTTGTAFLGEACAQGTALWVTADLEAPGDIARRAVRFGTAPKRLHVLRPSSTFDELLAAVYHVGIEDQLPRVVVIDTLASFARHIVDDPHSSAQWPKVLLPLVQLARTNECAVVIIHHATKAANGGYRDSTAIGALVDLLLEIQPDGSNAARRNVSAIGRWSVPSFAVELVEDRFKLLEGGDLSLDAQVLAFIGTNPRCSKSAVRSRIGRRVEEADVVLARLVQGGAVRNAGTEHRHAYVVAGAAAEPPPALKEADALPF